MSCWAIIPVKSAEDGKSRLAGALGKDDRRKLVRAMLAHVVSAAQDARLVDKVLLVGPSRHGLPDTVPLIEDRGEGLNPTLQDALASVAADGPDRLLVVAADLPALTAQELDLLAAAPADSVAIAPDRHGTGTNALSLPLPAARAFRFAFGADSFARHRTEAERLGLSAETILSQGLERDIDDPADLPDAAALLAKER